MKRIPLCEEEFHTTLEPYKLITYETFKIIRTIIEMAP